MPANKVKKNIYLVDYDISVYEGICALLEPLDVDVHYFENAHELLDLTVDLSPDCMIIELNLDEISGLELYKHLSARGVRPPVIFLTSHGNVSAAVDAMRLGAIDFIEKPYISSLLLKAVRSILIDK